MTDKDRKEGSSKLDPTLTNSDSEEKKETKEVATPVEDGRTEEQDAKLKAAAVAKAKAAATKKAKVASTERKPRKKKVEEPVEPSPKQPFLDQLLKKIKEAIGEDVIESAFINRPNNHLPTLIATSTHWLELARFLKEEELLSFDYLRNLSGVDYEEHMEVVYHLYSFPHQHELCVRVKTDREQPSVPSTTSIWAGANWNEREVFDLLGIDFPGHPNLKRIMMPDDWVGHPLRKDYEPLDKDI